MRKLVYQICHTKFQVSFYLWWIWPVLKHYKVPKYCTEECTFNCSRFSCLNFGYCCTVKLPSSCPTSQVKDYHNSPLQTRKKFWRVALTLWVFVFFTLWDVFNYILKLALQRSSDIFWYFWNTRKHFWELKGPNGTVQLDFRFHKMLHR